VIYTDTLASHRRRERTIGVLLAAFGAACLLMMSGWTLQSGDVVQGLVMAMAIAALAFAVFLIWRHPVAAVYAILVAAAAIEADPLRSGLSLTDRVPAFENIQSFLPVPGLIANPIECLAVAALAVLVLKSRVSASERLAGGPLGLPIGLLMAVVFLGLVRGHFSGGDLKIALWGVRGLFMLAAAYLLTINLIKTPQQVRLLYRLFMAAVALKGLIGLWRYVVDFHGHVQAAETGVPGNALMAHEESFFFLLVTFIAVVAYLLRLPKADRRLSLYTLAIVAVPFLANQRRVAIAALVIGLVLTIVILYAIDPERRRAILRGAMVAALILPVYLFVTWNATALYALPAQAIKSNFSPSERDASSNAYRDIEDLNLKATASRTPLLGEGFGVPMTQRERLPDIGDSFEWYLYLPHNNLLWLGMATGVIGLAAFAYFAVSAGLAEVLAIKATGADPYYQALFFVSLLTLCAFLAFALLDQGLMSQRLCIFTGVLLGLLPLQAGVRGETGGRTNALAPRGRFRYVARQATP
jgi:hypothetical protein